jgi:small subunit ribosomal protein S2
MKDVSLKELLEAGCHFGHRKERWHPKADEFIFQAREGIHIIDLAKTKIGLMKAAMFLFQAGKEGRIVLFVATKRQAKGVVMDACKRAGISYLTNRWIGGFLTNWEEVKKNLNKIHTMRTERTDGTWKKKFLKHEIVKLEKYLRQMEMVYSGVADLVAPPSIVFLIDIRREMNCLKEVIRTKGTSLAIVDTNADPNLVDFAIPANDDAVGSIQYVTNFLADAYLEGSEMRKKEIEKNSAVGVQSSVKKEEVKKPEVKKAEVTKAVEVKKVEVKKAEEKKPEKKNSVVSSPTFAKVSAGKQKSVKKTKENKEVKK